MKYIYLTFVIVFLIGCSNHTKQDIFKFNVNDWDNSKRIVIVDKSDKEVLSLIIDENDTIGQIYVNNYSNLQLNIVRYDDTLFAYIINDDNARYYSTTTLSADGLTSEGLILDRNEYFYDHGINYQLFKNGETKINNSPYALVGP